MLDKIIHKYLKVPYTLHVHSFNEPKNPIATVLLIHGIGTSWKSWQDVAAKLPRDVRVLAVDLLGFGKSPKPNWKPYNVKDQTDSIITTLLRRGLFGPVIIAGHSLGSLIAIEMARRYPLTVRSLVLVSPPLYRNSETDRSLQPERLLKRLYGLIGSNPQSSGQLLNFAHKHHLWPDQGYSMDEIGVPAFLATLDAAIVNQTSLDEIVKLELPIQIITGKLDPLVIDAVIKKLAKDQTNISWQSVVGPHEMRGVIATATVSALRRALEKPAHDRV